MAIPGFGEIAEQLRRSTVLVHSGGRGAGSGVIWSSDGIVVTNAHVVRGSRVNVQLWDGREFEAAIRSRDPRRDLAQLRIDAANLPSASAADSSATAPRRTRDRHWQSHGFRRRACHGSDSRGGPASRSRAANVGAGGCAPGAGQLRRAAGQRARPHRWHQHDGRGPPGARHSQQQRARFSFRGSGKRVARRHRSSALTFRKLPVRARHSGL